MTIKQMCEIDIQNRWIAYNFVETVVGDLVKVVCLNGTDIVAEAQKINLDDAYLSVRRQLNVPDSVLCAMATAERNTLDDVATGTMIYNNTNNQTQVYNGTVWI